MSRKLQRQIWRNRLEEGKQKQMGIATWMVGAEDDRGAVAERAVAESDLLRHWDKFPVTSGQFIGSKRPGSWTPMAAFFSL